MRRIWRLGQDKPCDLVTVQYANSFDDAVAELYHSWKLENARLLLSSPAEGDVVQLGAREAVTLVEHVAKKRGLLALAKRAHELSRRVKESHQGAGPQPAIVAAAESLAKKRKRVAGAGRAK